MSGRVAVFLSIFFIHPVQAGSLLGPSEVVVEASDAGVPQVPVVSPDGRFLVYEVMKKGGVISLWIAEGNGKNARPLTASLQESGKLPKTVENASWHPAGNHIVFEGTAGKSVHEIYVARFADGKITEITLLAKGRRPRFSYPFGRTLFCEVGDALRYVNIGADPLHPRSSETVPLRGPIQKTSGMEFSHPQLSRDGNTVFFAAGAAVMAGYDGPGADAPSRVKSRLRFDGVSRQKLITAWPRIQKASLEKRVAALKSVSSVFSRVDSPTFPGSVMGRTGDGAGILPAEDLLKDLVNLDRPVAGVSGVSRRTFLQAWLLGFLAGTEVTQTELEKRLGTRIWSTDLFGGELKTVSEAAPVPQKFPTSTADSRFVIFEAGVFSNRHLYVADPRTGKSAVLTVKGTYNSSPDLTSDDRFVYFESNEAGKKQIQRAEIQWEAVKSALK